MVAIRQVVRAALPYLVVLVVWEVVGRFALIADGALPAPGAIVAGVVRDASDYAMHVGVTAWAAGLGFAIGNGVAVLAGFAFALVPRLERVMRGANVALFALPPIAIVPVLIITLDGLAPRVALAALGCYYVTMAATVLGLRLADQRHLDLVAAYGGGAAAALRFVRLRQALPSVLAGLQIAAPNAVLGAILAEFGGGGRHGLGVYLIGSLGRADPARLWGIGLAATAMAGLAYLAVAIIARRTLGASRAVSMTTTLVPPGPVETGGTLVRGLTLASAIAMPFVLWQIFVSLSGAPAMIARGPLDVAHYLFFAERAGEAQARIVAALSETLPLTLAGLCAGLAAAFLLAVAGQAMPVMQRALLPFALVTQSMPLVALTPLLVLLLGRGEAVTLAITISVTFFPAFVTVAQGLSMTPPAAIDLVRASGGGRLALLRFVSAPFAVPYLLAAARLAAPRALLGVMIAEWVATGAGLGNLLNQSRGFLDYGMIWSVAAVSVAIALMLYAAVGLIERAFVSRAA